MEPLDRIDREMIALVRQNSRRSNREIARLVGLAESTCSGRLRRLEEIGAITGYHATVDPGSMGLHLEAILAARLVRHNKESIDAFWGHTGELTEVTSVFHLTGPNDFLVHLVVRDTEHLRDLTTTLVTTWPEVDRIETSVVFEHRQHWGTLS